MDAFLTLAFLFLTGSFLGWCIEVVFRRLAHGKWINPGFLTGPALPLYGFGLVLMYLLCGALRFWHTGLIWLDDLLLILTMMAVMTLLEYLTGLFSLKVLQLRLWDYSRRFGNIQGIICPLFTLVWGVSSSAYYFLLHAHVERWLMWLDMHPAAFFFVGAYYGVLGVDVVYSLNLVAKIRKWANASGIVVRYENLKEVVYDRSRQGKERVHFFFIMHTPKRLQDALDSYKKIWQKEDPLRKLKHRKK